MPHRQHRGSTTSLLDFKTRRPSLIRVAFLLLACSVAHVFWISKSPFQFKNIPTNSRDEEERTMLNNTNWRNVQYHSGEFGKGSPQEEHHIDSQCIHLSGYSYMHLPHGNYNNCSGPLATNTTCCYCFISRDYEDFGHLVNYKYWTCAVARNNSLLPFNSTSIDTKGGRVAWITGRFGHKDKFREGVNNYCQQVRELNFFEPQDIYCYWDSPDYVLQNSRFSRHLRFRTDPTDVSAKGGGFWFHKSVLLRHNLDVYKDGDFLVYTDIDRFDFFQLGTFHAVLEVIARRGDDLAIDVIGNSIEISDTKEDMLAAFYASKSMRESPQVIANVIVVRNSPNMKLFVDAWVDCMADWHMVSDEPSVLPNGPRYSDHRHDQSALSLLIKSFMTKQVVVGPPARPYAFLCEILTYKFKNETNPSCPFPAFYADRFKASSNYSIAQEEGALTQ